jgi:hypothetical protein
VQVAHLANIPIDLGFDYASYVIKVEEIAETWLR